jgi:hypothetical protein
MDKNKTYLMLGGTFLPAFVAVSAHLAYHKKLQLGTTDLLIFAGACAIGGYLTAQMLKNK